jgi:hypothetical protein
VVSDDFVVLADNKVVTVITTEVKDGEGNLLKRDVKIVPTNQTYVIEE